MASSNTALSYAATADFIAVEVGIKWYAGRRFWSDIAYTRFRQLDKYLQIEYPDSPKFQVISLVRLTKCLNAYNTLWKIHSGPHFIQSYIIIRGHPLGLRSNWSAVD
jgi:hypothetical protein